MIAKLFDAAGDCTTLPIGKRVVANVPKRAIYFEEMADGTWRLTVTGDLPKHLQRIEIEA